MVGTPRSSRRRRWDGSIQSTPDAHGLTSSRQQQIEYPPRRDSTAGSSRTSRKNSRRRRGQTSVVIGLAAAASLGRTRAQYVDGGSVSMDCDVCSCVGSSDDGTVEVFDNPSSGQRMAHLDGVYSEVLETTCDSTIIQLGETVYELSGLDLTDRELEVLDLSSADCTASSDTPSSADCYTGETTVDLDNGLAVDLSFCVCKWEEDTNIFYRSNVGAVVSGASEVDVPNDEMSICLLDEFTTQMLATVIEGETTYFNFELAIPGDGSSDDIAVEDAPSSTAESFMCGELEETPSPVAPTPEPTPESLPEPTPEPTAESTPQPIPETTPAPTAEATPKPTPEPTVESTPEPTPEPTPPETTSEPTSEPTPESTPPPTPEPTPKATTKATPEPTPEPTSEPTSPPEPIPEPTPAPVPEPTPAPASETTPAPTPAPTVKPTPKQTPESTPEPPAEPTPGPTAELPEPEPTPEPTPKPTPKPTREPTAEPALEPTLEPTPKQTSKTTPSPVTIPPTPAASTIAPVVLETASTPAPTRGRQTPPGVTIPSTPSPVASSASSKPPESAATPVPTTLAPYTETPTPAQERNGDGPTPSPSQANDSSRTSPSASPSSAPLNDAEGVEPTLAPSLDGGDTTGQPGMDTGATSAPIDSEAGMECTMPEDKTCTPETAFSDINVGMGWFYSLDCNTTDETLRNELGCLSDMCRYCFYNTPLYIETHPDDEVPDYQDCPCCVLDVYNKDIAMNEDGPICQNDTPAPMDVGPADEPRLAFTDAPRRYGGGEGIALAALLLLGVFTFSPFCAK